MWSQEKIRKIREDMEHLHELRRKQDEKLLVLEYYLSLAERDIDYEEVDGVLQTRKYDKGRGDWIYYDSIEAVHMKDGRLIHLDPPIPYKFT